jgi:chitin disaccharide deacetylase
MNPALRELGFGPRDRVAIVHVDDVGMCQATIPAFLDLLEAGLTTSGSTMTPCAWFPAVAAMCREDPSIDLGVHLTFTSEWTSCRWRPLTGQPPGSGMIDVHGYFHATREAFQQAADGAAVQAEIDAQLACALAAGIDPTHVDNHMFSLLTPPLFPIYCDVAARLKIPVLFFKQRVTGSVAEPGIWPQTDGLPVFDTLTMPYSRTGALTIDHAKALFDGLTPGLSTVLLHPSRDSAELRALTPKWQSRVTEYDVFRDSSLVNHVKNTGIQLIRYADLQRVMRKAVSHHA